MTRVSKNFIISSVQNIRTPLLLVISTFLVLYLYTKLAGPIPFSVNSIQTTKANLFSVNGTGKATGIPDTALLTLGVTKTTSTVLDAQNQTNTASNKIIEDLKALGIEEKNIKTVNYSVNPNYDFNGRNQRITGYTVSQTLEVNIKPIDTANKAIDSATLNGANIVGSVSFIFDDETRKKLEDDARKEAVVKAREKAESLAKATGIRLGRIVDVQESGIFEPQPFGRAQTLEIAEDQVTTQLQPGENSINLTITLFYETL